MNINRHNYEAFFLLYVDNELSADQLAELQQFLLQNTDLREELDMLQQAVLEIEPEMVFSEKDTLLKSEPAISLNNYETYFLLYVDNELSVHQRAEVERFVLQHPSLQESFTLLRQTQLEPELIAYEDKSDLFRHEKKLSKVVPFNWQRLVSAAVVAGLMFLIWFIPKHNSPVNVSPGSELVQTNTETKSNANGKVPTVDSAAPPQVIAKRTEAETKHTLAHTKKGPVTSDKTSRENSEKPESRLTNIPVNENVSSIAMTEKQEKVDKSDKRIKTDALPTDVHVLPLEQASNAAYTSTSNEAPQVQHAVYRETVPDDEDDRTLLIGGAEINKNKLRGLLKKAANIFDRRLKRDDKESTVQVASFEIKTK